MSHNARQARWQRWARRSHGRQYSVAGAVTRPAFFQGDVVLDPRTPNGPPQITNVSGFQAFLSRTDGNWRSMYSLPGKDGTRKDPDGLFNLDVDRAVTRPFERNGAWPNPRIAGIRSS